MRRIRHAGKVPCSCTRHGDCSLRRALWHCILIVGPRFISKFKHRIHHIIRNSFPLWQPPLTLHRLHHLPSATCALPPPFFNFKFFKILSFFFCFQVFCCRLLQKELKFREFMILNSLNSLHVARCSRNSARNASSIDHCSKRFISQYQLIQIGAPLIYMFLVFFRSPLVFFVGLLSDSAFSRRWLRTCRGDG